MKMPVSEGDLVEFVSAPLVDGCPRNGIPLRVTWYCEDLKERQSFVDVRDESTGQVFCDFNLEHFVKWKPKEYPWTRIRTSFRNNWSVE